MAPPHGGGRYPKPQPSPLPYAAEQVGDMLGVRPSIRRAVLELVYAQGHVNLQLGYTPMRGDLEDLEGRQLGELVLWLADGTRGRISRDEARIRELVIQGMAGVTT